MSVAGINEAYEDFEHQHVSYIVDSDTGATTGSNVQTDLLTPEPVDGLQRGELAELVALIETVFSWSEDVVASGHYEGGFEVSADADIHFLGPAGLGDTDVLQRQTDGIQTGTDAVTGEDLEPDVLRVIPFGGTATGSGGMNTDRRDAINYREIMGGGPVFDRHTDLHYHLQWYKDDDFGASVWLQHHFVWDVFER